MKKSEQIKIAYYHFKKIGDENFGGMSEEVTDYIELLEKERKEMLECLVENYKIPLSIYNQFFGMMGNTQLELSTIECKINGVIEKATGLNIEEVLKQTNGENNANIHG